MTVAAFLQAYAVGVGTLGARMLAQASWTARAPLLAILTYLAAAWSVVAALWLVHGAGPGRARARTGTSSPRLGDQRSSARSHTNGLLFPARVTHVAPGWLLRAERSSSPIRFSR